MQIDRRTLVTEAQWLEAVAAYELGLQHAADIARELGVSPATVSREFKRRGCRKGCRAMETVAELKAALDAKAHREARRRAALEATAMERRAKLDRLMHEMVKSLIAADKAGDLALAAPKIADIGNALCLKPLR